MGDDAYIEEEKLGLLVELWNSTLDFDIQQS
jgi:hypothetical protein